MWVLRGCIRLLCFLLTCATGRGLESRLWGLGFNQGVVLDCVVYSSYDDQSPHQPFFCQQSLPQLGCKCHFQLQPLQLTFKNILLSIHVVPRSHHLLVCRGHRVYIPTELTWSPKRQSSKRTVTDSRGRVLEGSILVVGTGSVGLETSAISKNFHPEPSCLHAQTCSCLQILLMSGSVRPPENAATMAT